MNLTDLAETGLVPDAAIRFGIRRLLSRRRDEISQRSDAEKRNTVDRFVDALRRSPLAVATEAANAQHYEVPADFFQAVLGPRLKYSACLFEPGDEQTNAATSLASAEQRMLRLTCERVEMRDGLNVLELGCGWGSLTLWLAEQYPQSQVTAVSNSASQREFIEARCRAAGLANVNVITADIREFALDDQFDRVISIEMFEHLRNYELLLRRVSDWLNPRGKAFVHVFCHREIPYLFETEGATNWMGRHFFTGGMMPSEDLFGNFQRDLSIEQQWRVNGWHYWKTCEAWLENLDQNRQAILAAFARDLPARHAKRQLQRWRIFFMACAELFRCNRGDEWFVAHYRFRKQDAAEHRDAGSRASGRSGGSCRPDREPAQPERAEPLFQPVPSDRPQQWPVNCLEVRGGNESANHHLSRPGLDLWVWSRTQGCSAAGGSDLHLLSSCASGRITRVLLADICGHGPLFSEVAGEMRDLMMCNVNSIRQTRMVRDMSKRLEDASLRGGFASTLISTYFAPTRSFTLCNAGHPPPMIFRAKDASWSLLKQSPSLSPSSDPPPETAPLGVVPTDEYQQLETNLAVGDMVLAYSNSLTECRSAEGSVLGIDGVLRRVRDFDPLLPGELAANFVSSIKREHPANLAAEDATVLLCRATTAGVGWRDNLLAPIRLLRPVADRTQIA